MSNRYNAGQWLKAGFSYFPLYYDGQMSTDPGSEVKSKNPSLLQDIRTVFSTILKWLAGIVVLALIAWWLLPNDWRIKYAAEYTVDSDQVVIERKPYNCDWDSAPIGSKHCHYENIVTVYNQYGHVIEGPGLEKTNLPSDQNPQRCMSNGSG